MKRADHSLYSTCAELYFINVLYIVPTTPLDNFDILKAVKSPGRYSRALPTFEGKSALRTLGTSSEKSINTCRNQVPGLSHASYGVESKCVIFCLFSTPSVLEKKLSLRYVWWPRTANRKIRILKEYEFKTLFNVHLHRSFKKVIFLPR